MIQLIDLPDDILYQIFTYISNDKLVELLDIPSIKDPVINALYSKVILGNKSTVGNIPELKGTEKLPIINTVSDIIRLRNKYSLIKPKRWIFERAETVIEQIRDYSLMFKDAKEIEVQFNANNLNYSKEFSEKFMKNSILITSFVDFDIQDLDKTTLIMLGKHVNTFKSIKFNPIIDFEKLSLFPKLTSLSIGVEFSPLKIHQFPKQLKKLSISLEFQIDDYIEQRMNNESAIKFEFPEGLTDLNIEFAEDRDLNSNFFNIDIAHLKKLEKLTISNVMTSGTRNNYCRWNLPENLTWLSYITFHSMKSPLKFMCPNLKFLRVMKAEDANRMEYIVNDLPFLLQELHTSAEAVVYSPPSYGAPPSYSTSNLNETIPNDNLPPSYDTPEMQINPEQTDSLDELKEKLSFPTSLQRLVIDGYLSEFGDSKTPIELPITITSLSLTEVSNIDLDTLQYLEKLQDLVIRIPKGGDEFAYKLPESLKSLEITDHKIKKFNIIAPNLENLTLRGNLSGVVDESRLILPLNLKKLSLQGCRIDEIIINFPQSLQWLDISMNNLKFVNNLPSGLKYLDLSMNRLGTTDDKTLFPKKNLETLNLSRNEIHDQWICKLDLESLTKLKNLYMAKNKFWTLNVDGLPISLIALDIHSGMVSSYIGDFKNLINLQELDLSDNKLSEHIKELGGNDSRFFGKNIIFFKV